MSPGANLNNVPEVGLYAGWEDLMSFGPSSSLFGS